MKDSIELSEKQIGLRELETSLLAIQQTATSIAIAVQRNNHERVKDELNFLREESKRALETFHSTNTSLLEENKRLLEAIEKAPHTEDCELDIYWADRNEKDGPACTCWKSEALSQHTEVDPSPSISEVERKVIEAARAWQNAILTADGYTGECFHYRVPDFMKDECHCPLCQIDYAQNSLRGAIRALPPVKGGG